MRGRHKLPCPACQTLIRKAGVRGHDAYYGITGNGRALASFRYHVRWAWRRWLRRRSNRTRLTWSAFGELSARFPLPAVRVVHSIYRAANS